MPVSTVIGSRVQAHRPWALEFSDFGLSHVYWLGLTLGFGIVKIRPAERASVFYVFKGLGFFVISDF